MERFTCFTCVARCLSVPIHSLHATCNAAPPHDSWLQLSQILYLHSLNSPLADCTLACWVPPYISLLRLLTFHVLRLLTFHV
jgi:hypothetical protein